MTSFETKSSVSPIFLEMVKKPVRSMNLRLKDFRVIKLKTNDSLQHALSVLCSEEIMSCPVVTEGGKFCGIITMDDLTHKSLEIMDQPSRPNRYSEEYLAKKRNFRNIKVGDIMEKPSSAEQINVPIKSDFSLFHAVEHLSRFNQERVAIVDGFNNIVGMLTRSMVISWIRDNSNLLGALSNTKVSDMRPYCLVPKINKTSRTINAFKMMKEQNVNAVAITDDSDELVDVVSYRDLRGISPSSNTFRFLWNTCEFFKDQVRDRYESCPENVICCKPNSTLKQTIDLMINNKVHRVFVVQDDRIGMRKPIDIIDMGCIIKYLLETLNEESSF